ncbi:hypothetical protein GCM10007094_12140 [Pseudovibrio japonicus]|uniref:Secreted protein n=1 Tax=Pseudovibrio japonicus TaxID=366534 RepID=A0ABQ3E4F4_9HYPH|nr:hypothetical protein [Pseudovibrio japonicus]GHB25622.1 hypothetical protein GCM10007094_12140 [Pseudovibrio japonicus]
MARFTMNSGLTSVFMGALLLSTLPVSASSIDAANETGERWEAFSTTAQSITGDIIVTPTSITMASGSVLQIEPFPGDVPNLYRFTGAEHLRLIRDNTLCGPDTTDGYLVLVSPGDNMLEIDVFDGDPPPGSVDNMHSAPNFCASYIYDRP